MRLLNNCPLHHYVTPDISTPHSIVLMSLCAFRLCSLLNELMNKWLILGLFNDSTSRIASSLRWKFCNDDDSFSSNSEELQPSSSRDADYLPSTDSPHHKVTEGELSDLIRDLELRKIRQNFWHQFYNSGIYYTTL